MHQKNFFTCLSEAVSQSLYILKSIKNYRLAVCFSGGKDSIVMEHLCRRAGINYDIIHNITTIDPPELIKFIRLNYPRTIFIRPHKSFYEYVEQKGPPNIFKRWCCEKLKEYKLPYYDYKILGIRWEESLKRRNRLIVNDKRKQILPIYHWAEWQIWEYIQSENLKYPALYDEGYHRLGCVPCPYHSYNEHLIAMQRWPWIYRKFKEAAGKYIKRKALPITIESLMLQYIKNKGVFSMPDKTTPLQALIDL